jgi:light-regulated signal transduction histidine kinase (bacteriophytochrome)
MLDQQFGHSLPEGGKIFLEKVLRGTERISDIIEGVLAYSSLDSEHRDHTVVNLAEVLQQVQADLELQIQNKGARISCTNLPTIVASPVSMHQLFYNLLNNALKFTRNGIAPLISIHGAVLGQDAARRALVSVQDNGIGFEQHYADRIFTTFTRLHSKDAYEGSGLGLALCKKIVERHGGTIRAESTPGEGAAFILELPLG